MFGLQVTMRLMVLGFDSSNGKWYSFQMERIPETISIMIIIKTIIILIIICNQTSLIKYH